LAGEPRDKAYAFLWALKRCRPVDFDIFNVDYTKTVETVFTEFTVAVAHDTGDFVALFKSACQQDKMPTLPSWVPDWSRSPRFQDWNFLRPYGAMRTMKRVEHPHPSDQEMPTFQNATMHIRGLRQADCVSRLERLPVLNSSDSLDGGIFLGFYKPRAVETICVGLNNVFQMLDDADGLACLSKLCDYVRTGRDGTPDVVPEDLECLVPGALDRPYTVNYTVLRGIIRSYIQAKRSPDPSDVDVGEWSRGLTAEFQNILTEQAIESLLLKLSSYKDYSQGTLNAWDVEVHIVAELISSSTFFTNHIIIEWEVMQFASGKRGATIFKTDGGRLGIGQANIDVGDEVVRWKGVPRPIVVRKLETVIDPDSQSEQNRCRLVSVAEVDCFTRTEEGWREEDLVTYVVL
jgi:hypothetical protein